jgi:hypothetical protein
MTKEEKEARIAELKKIPQQVQMATLFAFALGIVTLARMPVAAYAAHLSVGRGFLYGLFMLSLFFVCGVSLYTRNRVGYVVLTVFSLLPMLGLFGLFLHLLRLVMDGSLAGHWPETIHFLVGVLQLVVTVLLFRYLLSRQVRDFIWKPANAGRGAAEPPKTS